MKLKLDRDSAARILTLDWSEIIAGVREQWLDPGVAVDFAIKQIEAGNSEPILLDLAACSYSDTIGIHDSLERIEAQIPGSVIDNKKWALIMLTLGFEQQRKLLDPLQFVEEVYAEYDYPSEISHLVRYMPNEGPPRDLMREWKQFIDAQVYDVLVSRNRVRC